MPPPRTLTRDGRLLFATRAARMFAYGLISVVLVFYLRAAGLDEVRVGVLLTLTLLGDTAISLGLTTRADRAGRRATLFAGALLMIMAGAAFALTSNFWLLLAAATVGVISPSGNEVGPFLPVEQAALAHTIPAAERTAVFAWYNLTGSVTTALGALCGGAITHTATAAGLTGADAYRPVILTYGGLGLLMALAFARVSPAVEVNGDGCADPGPAPRGRLGLRHSLGIVLRLSALFSLDAFGGGFVIQSIIAYWFYLRFRVELTTIGAIFFGANLLAGLSALAAARLARRFGLLNTMVLTHLPSNALLLLVPLMPTLPLAVLVLLLRFAISQMDVPTRQSYTMAVVQPAERSAAAGITGVARSIGASVSALCAALLLGSPALAATPFFLAGGIKILYDLLLYRSFKAVQAEQ